jgi:hypothetical protein
MPETVDLLNVFDQVDLDAFKSQNSPASDGGFVNLSDGSDKSQQSEDDFLNISDDFKKRKRVAPLAFGPNQTEIITIIDPQFMFIPDFFTRKNLEKPSQQMDYEYVFLL